MSAGATGLVAQRAPTAGRRWSGGGASSGTGRAGEPTVAVIRSSLDLRAGLAASPPCS